MLKVSEQFYSVQGEGKTIGIPAVFLRLQGCNLTCGGQHTVQTKQLDSGATWRCDTMETWLKGEPFSFDDILLFWKSQGWVEKLKQGAHLVVTGGEPLLYQADLLKFITFFESEYKFLPVLEIESNATIMPDPALVFLVRHFNLSPKLGNSGVSFQARFKDDILRFFNSLESSTFKFVISSEDDLAQLIQQYLETEILSRDKIYLMPACDNRQELQLLEASIVDYCKIHCFKFSTRLQVQIWDQVVGV